MAEFKYIVTTEEQNVELKQIVRTHFAFSSRLMSKLKAQGLIRVNGQVSPGWIKLDAGDIVTIDMPDETSEFPPEDIPIDVVFEDDDILVINKQPGYVVHPTKGKPYHTIANGIMKKMLDEGKSYKIRFVNRLDMNTSGLLIVAKNSHAQDNLEKQMQADLVQKKYIALVDGVFNKKDGTIDAPIGRPDMNEVERWILPVEKGGFPSITHYHVLEDYKEFSLVELRLETGRTHQIRVHMASIGHPVVGDHLYCNGDPFEYRRIHGDNRPPLDGTKGPRDTNPEKVSDLIDRQALHAYSLDFTHPILGAHMHLEAKLPEDISKAIQKIKKTL